MRSLREALRELETRLYRRVRHPEADAVARVPAVAWDRGALDRFPYCVVVSYRLNGTPVATPVWFATKDDRLVFRSAATDGKVRRIARNPDVLVAPCTFRGAALGPPMRGRARVLGTTTEIDRAERLLSARYGLGRRLYAYVRAPLLDPTFVEVTAAAEGWR